MTMTNTLMRASVNRSQQQLDSLEIQNFRVFRSLKIERLGNVNLIVGKNSVGKSALLEALRLYSAQGAPDIIRSIMLERDEWLSRRSSASEWSPQRSSASEINSVFVPVTNLFYGREQFNRNRTVIRIGPHERSGTMLSLEVGWAAPKKDGSGETKWEHVTPPNLDATSMFATDEFVELQPRLFIQFGSDKSQSLRLDRDWERTYRLLPDAPTYLARSAYVPAAGLIIEEVVERWEMISLTEARTSVIEALKIIVPGVENLDIIGGRRVQPYSTPVVQVKVASMPQPIPLRSLGEGMMRLFGLALVLATAKGAMLLIDEIDSGLHHSVQTEVWRLIFAMAEQLNVQVFATTHSWDCVSAFQEVAAENDRQDGMLIRLEKEGDEIIPVLIDEETLAIVTREQIEIR